ncbi:hypothetical protein Tsubulata_051568 [Turnera subulata]|uniref:3'-5' exonuclease domain-containing protein n=1 Tax=Turnera subulata TaxID=218843 RepID=A0A9Q0J449_9ROSI|nr:hypothetical protein Tsubulata_051568 [Turnera subulata]
MSSSPPHITVKFHGEHIDTTVTASAFVVDRWVANVLHKYKSELPNLIVGLDTEWYLPREQGDQYHKVDTKGNNHYKVAIIQLCVHNTCLIYKLCHTWRIPQSLITFLGNKDFTFVGKGVEDDARRLYKDYELYVANTRDVADWAASVYDDANLERMGLKNLVLKFLDKELEKPRRIILSRWDATLLTSRQIQYACIDAFVSFELGFYLSQKSGVTVAS